MPLDDLWQVYTRHGYAGVRDIRVSDPLDSFYLALLAFSENDLAHALGLAYNAAHNTPDQPVYVQAAAYLDRVLALGKTGVYVEGDAFAAFIRGGGNLGLYATCSAALRAVYDQYESLSVLDVGVGDGLALLPALSQTITRLDLIEPSGAMLAHCTAELDRRGHAYTAHNTTLQDYARTGGGHWDVIQATWSLQSIPPDERPAALSWIRAHGDRVLIAEFDAPAFDDPFEPARVRYVVDRYRRGLAEYADDGRLVAQGFLMPVMFGYFDQTAARTNWEGPIQEWENLLRAAGFQEVRRQALYDYWWAEAYLIDAR